VRRGGDGGGDPRSEPADPGLNDSKKLTEARREKLYDEIIENP
jgi:ribonuclease HII